MSKVVAKIFKNAIYHDLIKYSDPNSNYVASEESLRILIHFIFKDGQPEPQIIPSSKIQDTINQFKDNLSSIHKQYFIEYGNRSIKTPGDPNCIHYAAMNLYRNGSQVVAVIADHYHGNRFYHYFNYEHEKTDNIKIIFLGGRIYQADHNHCLIFSMHHLTLSRQDPEFRELMIAYANKQTHQSFKITMDWIQLPLMYNMDIQSASFYFKTYMDLLLEKSNGEELYQSMRDFIEFNFIVAQDETEVSESKEQDGQVFMTTRKFKFLKLINKGICNKTINFSIQVYHQIEALENKFALMMLSLIGDSIPEETFITLKQEYQWSELMNYSNLSEMDNIDIELDELTDFILTQDLDIASVRKNINLSSALLINLFLIEIAYTHNKFFYDILTSSLKENFSFYKKLIGFDAKKLKEFFPNPTFDFERAFNRYNPEYNFKSFLKNFIIRTRNFIRLTNYNIYYSPEKEEYLQELVDEIEMILPLFQPVKKYEEYQQIFCDLSDFLKNSLKNSYCFTQNKVLIIEGLHESINILLTKLRSFKDVILTREALVLSEEFAITFVSSHQFVQYLFSNSPLAHLYKEYIKPVTLTKTNKAASTRLNTISLIRVLSLDHIFPDLQKVPKFGPGIDEFSKIRSLFLSPIFQLSAKIDLFELKKITDALLISPYHSLEIVSAKLNEVYSQFNHIQLLLSYVLNGKSVALSKADIETILLHRKGAGLKFLVVNHALLQKEITLSDLDNHRTVINRSKFVLTADYASYASPQHFQDEYNSLLEKTGKRHSTLASPVSVTSFSVFSESPVRHMCGSPIESTLNTGVLN